MRAEKTKSDGVLALLILVQSDLEPEYVNQRIEIFLSSVVVSLLILVISIETNTFIIFPILAYNWPPTNTARELCSLTQILLL